MLVLGEYGVRRCMVSSLPVTLIATTVSIAQVHFRPEAWFRAICADDTPVGFVMLYDSHLGVQPPQNDYYERRREAL
jgi:hypothetical protein